MKQNRLSRKLFIPALGILALLTQSPSLHAQSGYRQQNLVSDIPGMAAHTDSNLVNPWGIASSPTSPFWVSNNGTGTTTLYDGNGKAFPAGSPLVVAIPGGGGGASAPTGQVFNGTTAFNGDRFIFASEDGAITGWRGTLGTTAETLKDNSGAGAIYKGITLGTVGTSSYLYAADFHNNQVYVLPNSGAPVLSGTFTDPSLPSNYAPFNVQNLGGSLFVTYAKTQAGSNDEVAGPGNGYVDKYDLNGNLLMRVASQGPLNAPWAVALAPSTFGQFGGDLLVGNFGDGMINAFNPTTGDLLGSLKDSMGNPLVIEGLWGLRFGNGGLGGKTNTLYFAAGINDEAHGLFGSLTPVPEASTTSAFAALGLLAVCASVHLRRRKHQLARVAAGTVVA